MRPHSIFFISLLFVSTVAVAELNCPPMPADMTGVTHDVKSNIEAAAGKLGPISAGQVKVQTEVQAKAIYEKYPNLDKLTILQMLSATYCSGLNGPEYTQQERTDRWMQFMDKYLELRPIPPPPPPTKTNPSSEIKKNDSNKLEQYDVAVSKRNKGDYVSALNIFQSLAQDGDAKAQYQLGKLYYFGSGVEVDYKKAFYWFKLSAERGVREAQHNLAVMYQDGNGTEKNEAASWQWYTQAAKNGFAPSQEILTSNDRSW
ncbi:sel1 repeat family protein [Pseudomonas sp. PB120]|uniref:tetratricopeptide repeat protein n=1 Tax=Pseudomonas sp. PB120 TaxID=2494700 RepID=UPI0012FD028C|nr:tetratricopeptide repeat protein [Pseudomonas sp. PB120]MVV49016.1 sel1 repeat family protein [Pseudomonas sp. PB120]